jgi:hypothetical protein
LDLGPVRAGEVWEEASEEPPLEEAKARSIPMAKTPPTAAKRRRRLTIFDPPSRAGETVTGRPAPEDLRGLRGAVIEAARKENGGRGEAGVGRGKNWEENDDVVEM